MIPFSLMWGGFSFFWEYKSVSSGTSWFFDLWGVPFFLIGVYMIVGRFFYEAMLRARVCYGLTNERVIIISGLFSRTVQSMQVKTLNGVSLSEEAARTGTITFGPNMSHSAEDRVRVRTHRRPSSRLLTHGTCSSGSSRLRRERSEIGRGLR